MKSVLTDLAFAGLALFAGAGLALASRAGAGSYAYLVLFEPLVFAWVVSRPASHGRSAGRGGWLIASLALQRRRFELTGWAGVVAVGFSLSAYEALQSKFDPVATFVFAGVALSFVAGVPIAVVTHGLRLSETWRDLREVVLESTRAVPDESPPHAAGGIVPPPANEVGPKTPSDAVVEKTWSTEFRLPSPLGERIASVLGIETHAPAGIPATSAENMEQVLRKRWERERQAADERRRANPLTSVEGWEALRRRLEAEGRNVDEPPQP